MIPDRVFADLESFELDRAGREFKAYCTQREGACSRIQEGLYRFDLKGGDWSKLDANRADSPNRSQIAGYGASSRMEPGASTFMRFGHFIERPAEGRLISHHLNIAQWACTGDKNEFHTPALAIEVRPVNRISNDHRLDIDTTTLPGRDTSGQIGKVVRQASVAYELNRINWFDVEFKDSLGGPGGWLKVWLNGSKFVDYVGPTSRDNAAGINPAWGIYRNNVPQDLVAYVFQPEYGEA